MNATPKQVSYALHLMAAKGYDTRFMGAEHKALGASMRERSGPVAAWLRGMDRARVSKLIDALR